MSKSIRSNKEAKKHAFLADTEGKEGSQALEEACRQYQPICSQGFMNSIHDGGLSKASHFM